MKQQYMMLIYSVVALLLLTVLMIGVKSQVGLLSARDIADQSQSVSVEEEAELLRMIPVVTAWIVGWSSDNEPCRNGQNIALKAQLEKMSGKQVTAKIEVSKSKIYVSMDELHHRFVFRRTQAKGLYLEKHQPYCGNSYDEDVKENAESSTRALQIMKDMKDKLSAIGIHVPDESEQSTSIIYREDRLFEISSLIHNKKPAAEKAAEWGDAKKALYNKILNSVSLDSRVTCEEDYEIALAIPDFEVDDPGIYVLLNERPGYYNASGQSIVYLAFSKNDSNTGSEISEVKRIGLEDEVRYFSQKIKEKSSRTTKIICGRSVSL